MHPWDAATEAADQLARAAAAGGWLPLRSPCWTWLPAVLLLAGAAFLVLAGVVPAASLVIVMAVLAAALGTGMAAAGLAAEAQAVALSAGWAPEFVACLAGFLVGMLLAAASLVGVPLVTALVGFSVRRRCP